MLTATCSAIIPVDRAAAAEVQRRLDHKTKPRGSLGQVEELACRLAAIYRTPEPTIPTKAMILMAADHGVAEEGVSAYPQEVTAQMLGNFSAGGAAINVLARQAQCRLVVIDMGTKQAGALPGVRDERLGSGTANFTRGPAMSRESAELALAIGIRMARELSAEGVGIIGVGDMGIANTTSASALTAALTGMAIEKVTGRGTGIDEERWRRKVTAIERGLKVNQPNGRDPLDVLSKVGGFEIAGLAGVMLGAAACRVPVVLDGFITGAAALVAVGLCPHLREYLIAGHRSVEPGHQVVLRHLELRPLLDLDMRLGEGTGAALALHLVEASLHLLREMASFAAAGVTDTGM